MLKKWNIFQHSCKLYSPILRKREFLLWKQLVQYSTYVLLIISNTDIWFCRNKRYVLFRVFIIISNANVGRSIQVFFKKNCKWRLQKRNVSQAVQFGHYTFFVLMFLLNAGVFFKMFTWATCSKFHVRKVQLKTGISSGESS